MEKKIKIVAENRKARHDFTIHETYEAGIALTGTEVKSLRAGQSNMKDSYAQITKNAEVIVCNLHISLMTRATGLTTSRCATVNFCCIRQKSAALSAK